MITNEIAELVWELCQLDPEETMWNYDREGFADHLRRWLPTRKLCLHYCTCDAGDGTYWPTFFETAEKAEARKAHEIEVAGYALEDCVASLTLTLNPDGEVIDGFDFIRDDDDGNETY